MFARSPFRPFGRVALASPFPADVGGLSYSVSISGLTANPTYGTTAQIGVELTASASGWTGDTPSSVAWQWYAGGEAISGATSASYTPVEGDDLENIYARATPAAGYSAKNSPAYTVRYAPPVAAGALEDQTYNQGSGNQTYATAGDFTGGGLTFAVNTVSGVSINSASGLVTTDTTDLKASTAVVVTATNSGGATTSGYSLVVQVAPTLTLDSLSHADGGNGVPDNLSAGYSITGDPGTLTLLMAAGGDSLSVTAEQLDAGSGGTDVTDFGSIVGFTNGVAAAIAGLTADTSSDTKISACIKGSNGVYSNVMTTAITGTLYSTAPIVTAAATASTTSVTWTFNRAVYSVNGDGTGLSLTSNGSGKTITSVTGWGTNTLTINFSGALSGGETLLRSYSGATGDVVDEDGNPLASFTDQAVTNNVSGFDVILLTPQFSNSTANPLTFTVDLEAVGAEAGDKLVMSFGTNNVPISMTVQGDAASLLEYNGGSTGGRMALFSHTLLSAGTSSDAIEITKDGGGNSDHLQIGLVKSGKVDAYDTAYVTGAAFSMSATPTEANNRIIGFSHSNYPSQVVTWSTLGNASSTPNASSPAALVTSAYSDDVTEDTPYSVTGTVDANRCGLGIVAISEA